MKDKQCRAGLAPLFIYRLAKTHTTLLFIGILFAGIVLISGCGTSNHHHHGASVISSEKVFTIDLNQKAEYQPLLSGKPQTHGMRSGRVYLQPGESCGVHSTGAHEETLVFLSGKGTALIGKEQTAYEIGEGKIIYIPPNTTHDMKNTGSEPLIYIYCVTPIR
jgi:mannose-6-phosphate isomerase-like protein (cupin superfamily)